MIHDREEAERWGVLLLAHIMQATNDRAAIAHLDFEPNE